MKKEFLSLLIILIILIVGLSGCIDTSETPNIEFIQEEGWLIVSYVEKLNLTWDNINISISSGNYSDIGFHYSSMISSLIDYGNGSSCPSSWGFIAADNGIFLQRINAKVTLRWIPTNAILGEWNFI